ncbi:MAG: hypothetical protein FWF59_11980 [Turicibacter sp.]|nr:hypothetical protein [Turicibacter sp.]
MILETLALELQDFNYNFQEFTETVQYPYIVSEIFETYTFEDNLTKGQIILTLFTRGKQSELVDLKNDLKRIFTDYRRLDNGETLFITYDNSQAVPTGDLELKRQDCYFSFIYSKYEI